MNIRKIFIILILLFCIFSVGYGMYYQLSVVKEKGLVGYDQKDEYMEENAMQEFDDLFNNNVDYQEYEDGIQNKEDVSKDLVYTKYTINEVLEDKYEIRANIPTININNDNVFKINKEIKDVFQEKANSIVANSSQKGFQKTIYTVEYTACLNENILSLAIRATLKEGSNVQRLIIKTYTYNLSSNEEIKFEDMLAIKRIDEVRAQKEIKNAVEEGITRANNLKELGYSIYNRDINSDMYSIANSNNYFLGKNGAIYIIYAYGNTNYTSEKDIAIIK